MRKQPNNTLLSFVEIMGLYQYDWQKLYSAAGQRHQPPKTQSEVAD